MDEKYRIAGIKKGLRPQLLEIGKIKIGERGEERDTKSGKKMRIPKKLDHFMVVKNDRDSAGDFIPHPIMKEWGGSPREIPIKLLFDDMPLNLHTEYRLQGKLGESNQKICYGDGNKAYRKSIKDGKIQENLIDCDTETCPLFYKNTTDHTGCKWYGILTCLVEGVETIGGCFRYRTTSEIALNSMATSLFLISQITQGILAGIKNLKLTLTPTMVQPPWMSHPVRAFIVNIEYKGTNEALAAEAIQIRKDRIKEREAWQELDIQQPKAFLLPADFETVEDIQDVSEEFFPNVEINESDLNKKIPEKKSEETRKKKKVSVFKSIKSKREKPKTGLLA